MSETATEPEVTKDEKELAFFTCDIERAKAKDGAEEEIFEFVATTAIRDRMGDEIPVSGWETKNFMTNPVVLWGHDHYRPTIGNVRYLEKRYVDKIKAEGLVAGVAFVPREIDPFAGHIRDLVDGGWLRTVSVGFQSLQSKWIDESDEEKAERLKKEPDLTPGRVFKRKELLELSLCNVPANPQARRVLKAAGLLSDADDARYAAFFARQAEIEASARALDKTREIKAQLDTSNGMVTITAPMAGTYSERKPYIENCTAITVPALSDKEAHARLVAVAGNVKGREGWTLTKTKAWLKDNPDLVRDFGRTIRELEITEDDDRLAEVFQNLIAEQDALPDDAAADDAAPETVSADGNGERASVSTDTPDPEPPVASPDAPTPVSAEPKEQRFRFVTRSTTKTERVRIHTCAPKKEA